MAVKGNKGGNGGAKKTSKAKGGKVPVAPEAKPYAHKEEALLRPEVGLQAEFKKRKAPVTYRYDPSLDPQLSWDEGNAVARERAEELIAKVQQAKTLEEARTAARELEAMSKPFLNWAGKAERGSFQVATLPLFIHDRLSTKAILETLKSHKPQQTLGDFYGDPGLDIADRQLKAYEYPGPWTNRLILGDSLVVMSSLLHYDGLGGQVQMIYMDPPYGVKFGSNFQPFVRSKDVEHNKDNSMTREPEMVQAYRDTWDLGVHSYLTYLRDRLAVAHRLLRKEGSILVQISDDNLHLVRNVLDEIFGSDNFFSVIAFSKTTGQTAKGLASVADYILWYAKDARVFKERHHKLWEYRGPIENPYERYVCVETESGEIIDLTVAQKQGKAPIPAGRILRLADLTSQTGSESSRFVYRFQDQDFSPSGSRGWSTSKEGLDRLNQLGRLFAVGTSLRWKNYHDEFPFKEVRNIWTDLKPSGFGEEKLYVVQTLSEVVERCILMATDPGDLVLDPTCGSGTTAYVAEKWGRRWITIDTSRVPISLAKQRLLTATFPYYKLQDSEKGPSGGFSYSKWGSEKGEGAILHKIGVKTLTREETEDECVLVDRPDVDRGIVRVAGAFVVEAVIPTPLVEEVASAGAPAKHSEAALTERDHLERMLDQLRRAPVLQLPKGKVTFENVRRSVRSLDLHAVADQDYKESIAEVAFVFGPENGAVSEKLVFDAIRECNLRGYAHLYVIGFAIQDAALKLIQKSSEIGVPATYVAATMDILMGEDASAPLLKTNKHSQVFSVTGQPDVRLFRLKKKTPDGKAQYRVELRGLDTFDPVTMDVQHVKGEDVPAWFVDANYNDLSFWVSQAFFPRTGAWENLRKALKGYTETVWKHLEGTASEPFPEPETGKVAVKAIDMRGNELLVVLSRDEATPEA